MTTFRDSVGVNLHIPDLATPYNARWSEVLALLVKSGIQHARDSAWPTFWGDFARIHSAHLDLVRSGVRLCLLWNTNYDVNLLAQLVSLPSMEPGLEILEGPNELDISGGSGWVNAYNDAAALLAMARPKVQVLAPSLTQGGSPAQVTKPTGVDYANLHAYWSGRNPETNGWGDSNNHGFAYGALAWNIDTFAWGMKNMMVSESGYGTDIPDAVRVQYVARLLLNNFAHKIARTYLYQFLAVGNNGFDSFGLLNNDLSIRPEFTAVSELIRVIGSAVLISNPPMLFLPPHVSFFCFQLGNRTGTVVWQNGELCNPADTKTLTLPAPITLPIPGPYQRFTLQPDGTLKADTVSGSFVLDEKVAVLLA